ncbi:MAG TPA: hypothetical protein PK466_05400 [Thermotogota bacterium]|nr:hypothetical protein [Thermotogota bacterium]
MNNFKKAAVILLVFVTLFTFTGFASCEIITEISDYAKTVSNFCEVIPDEIHHKIKNHDRFLLYMGRETCPGYVGFAPLLNETAQEVNVQIFYEDKETLKKLLSRL